MCMHALSLGGAKRFKNTSFSTILFLYNSAADDRKLNFINKMRESLVSAKRKGINNKKEKRLRKSEICFSVYDISMISYYIALSRKTINAVSDFLTSSRRVFYRRDCKF